MKFLLVAAFLILAPPVCGQEEAEVALDEMIRTAESGDSDAQYKLGVAYANGDGQLFDAQPAGGECIADDPHEYERHKLGDVTGADPSADQRRGSHGEQQQRHNARRLANTLSAVACALLSYRYAHCSS